MTRIAFGEKVFILVKSINNKRKVRPTVRGRRVYPQISKLVDPLTCLGVDAFWSINKQKKCSLNLIILI